MHSSHPFTAIVTGSSRGIGAAIALRLATQGNNIVVNYLRNEKAARKLQRQIESTGNDCHLQQADVTIPADRDRLVAETIKRFGSIDMLVNNAGITSPGRSDVLESTEENWDLVHNTNLKGPFFLALSVAKQMLHNPITHDNRGMIININSISSYTVSENRADYCIAKRGMEMMTKVLAVRLAREAIRVFEICPGVIKSDMTAPVKDKYDLLLAQGLAPIARWGTGDDVARAVSMLAQGELAYSTGERINVDGGFHIRTI